MHEDFVEKMLDPFFSVMEELLEHYEHILLEVGIPQATMDIADIKMDEWIDSDEFLKQISDLM